MRHGLGRLHLVRHGETIFEMSAGGPRMTMYGDTRHLDA